MTDSDKRTAYKNIITEAVESMVANYNAIVDGLIAAKPEDKELIIEVEKEVLGCS